MAFTLPYEFDTIALPRNILKGFVAGGGFMLVLALAMLAKYGALAAVPFPLAAAFLGWIVHRSIKAFPGRAKGTITRDAVVVEATALGPIRLPSPAGRHPLRQFRAIRVTYFGPNRNSAGYLYGQVDMVGREGTPDVCVAYERDAMVKALAPEIATAVGLPLEQVGLAPFDH